MIKIKNEFLRRLKPNKKNTENIEQQKTIIKTRYINCRRRVATSQLAGK